ncbi:MAG: hypothetical protein NPIRA01_30980 [Nitrospirales bacterium]|nr:MAG: hypothetical protein NPIRA01_30980 [Nitrospirales bacterium]
MIRTPTRDAISFTLEHSDSTQGTSQEPVRETIYPRTEPDNTGSTRMEVPVLPETISDIYLTS